MKIQELTQWINPGGTKITEAIVLNNKNHPVTLTYWTLSDNSNYGSEFYQGKNYLIDEYNKSIPSYSRNYIKLKGLPSQYRAIVLQLKKKHIAKWGK